MNTTRSDRSGRLARRVWGSTVTRGVLSVTLGVGSALGVTIAEEAPAEPSSLRPDGDLRSRRTGKRVEPVSISDAPHRPPRASSERVKPRDRDSAVPRWRRARRRLLRFGAVVLALIVAFFAAGAIYLATLPSVGDARQRAYRILALHHGRYAGPQPARRLRDAVVAVEDEHFYANFLIKHPRRGRTSRPRHPGRQPRSGRQHDRAAAGQAALRSRHRPRRDAARHRARGQALAPLSQAANPRHVPQHRLLRAWLLG